MGPWALAPWLGLLAFDEKALSLYARGMTVREIRKHRQARHGVAVCQNPIRTVTHAVVDAVKEWQNRPLDRL
jgi:putative transposase